MADNNMKETSTSVAGILNEQGHIGTDQTECEQHVSSSNLNDEDQKSRSQKKTPPNVFAIYHTENGGKVEQHGNNNKNIFNVQILHRDENINSDPHRKGILEEQFLKRVKLHCKKVLQETFQGKSMPIIEVVDMTRKLDLSQTFKSCVINNNEFLFGRGIQKIQLEELQNGLDGELAHRVMILGDAGAGKSTLSKIFAKKALQQEIPLLLDRQIVLFIDARDLKEELSITAFNLFFTLQMATDSETKLSPELQKVGEEWIENNSDKVMIVIDGLDRCPFVIAKEWYSKLNTRGKTVEILINVIRQHIWGDAAILITSRWRIFWELRSEYRPSRIIALKGFDNGNMEIAAHHYLPDKSKMFLDFLYESKKQIRSFCLNPLFLYYAARVFEGDGNLPDSLSGLVTSVFLYFIRSDHAQLPDVQSIAKLAYHGIMDNRYQFTIAYLKKIDVERENIKKFLSTLVMLENPQDKCLPEDEKYQFSHQLMQEFCAALHIVNLSTEEVEKLICGGLNDARLELMRLFCYGIILNEKNRKKLEIFLDDRQCSVEKYKEMLCSQMLSMLSNGTISDMKIVNLMNECDDDLALEWGITVQKIIMKEIIRLDTKLLSRIDGCTPLDKVYLEWIKSDAPHLNTLSRSGVKSMEMNGFELNDTDLEPKGYTDLASSLKLVGCRTLCLADCCLSKEKVTCLGKGCEDADWVMQTLIVNDDEMEAPVYHQLPLVIGRSKCSNLWLYCCLLNKDKLSQLAEGFHDHHSQIQLISVCDVLMKGPGYYQLAVTVEQSKCSTLVLRECQLDKEKLLGLENGFREHKVQLQILQVNDDFMDLLAYYQLGAAIGELEHPQLFFGDCKLKEEKLIELGKGFEDHHAQIEELNIMDILMDKPGYYQLPLMVKQSQCKRLALQGCQLNKEKLSRLGEGFLYHKAQILAMTIVDIKMDRRSYYQLALTIQQSQCKYIVLDQCQLTKEKFSGLTEGIKYYNVELPGLQINDTTMDSSAYNQLAITVGLLNCPELLLVDCLLDKEKLMGLAGGFQEHHAQLRQLTIKDDYMDKFGYYHLALAVHNSKCPFLILEECHLTEEKLSGLAKYSDDHHVQLQTLMIKDCSMDMLAYHRLALVIGQFKCLKLVLKDCQLDKEKLIDLAGGFQEHCFQLQVLQIEDNSMETPGYCQLASTVGQMTCVELVLKGCHLTEQKLLGLGEGFQDQNTQIEQLTVIDISMNRSGFYQLAQTIKQSKCQFLQLQSCKLTKEKLSGLAEGLLQYQNQNLWLSLFDGNLTPTDELVLEVCNLMRSAVKNLIINGWQIETFG